MGGYKCRAVWDWSHSHARLSSSKTFVPHTRSKGEKCSRI